jgi:O-antigen ligase
LISARAYWPSELNLKLEGSTGLHWAQAMLLVTGLALAAALAGGSLRLRWSWTDAAAMALWVMVGLSTASAADRRAAINLAWEWGAVGLAYLLIRNLPRTRDESAMIAAGLVATAVAVAVYGLYQVVVEYPIMQAYYRANLHAVLLERGITPGSPAHKLFEQRALASSEPMSTFALTNSLAGFLVGPLVLCLAMGGEAMRNLTAGGRRLGTVALAAVPALALLVCLLLTKSRSAYIGLAVGLAMLVARQWRRASPRSMALAVLAVVVVVAGLVAVGLATRRLDREVLTESGKSLRFRRQYWVGAWGVIAESPRAFWLGRGPGNFGGPYLLHKLPDASEDVVDPHNLVLEVWATAGAPAALALLTALALAFRNLLGPAVPTATKVPDSDPSPLVNDPAPPPSRARWLLVSAGAGWLMVVLVGVDTGLGNPGFFTRWMILGFAWIMAVLFGSLLWRSLDVPAAGLGAGAVALVVNLLAAGGIGISAVSLMLWMLIALGLNLRDDRNCSRLRLAGGRLTAFALAAVWAALLGTFQGAVGPFWESEAAIREAEAWLNHKPPDFKRAQDAFDRAIRADQYSARPWLGLAYLEFEHWQSRGAKATDLLWKRVPVLLLKAVSPKRNTTAWHLHRDRALVSRDLLARLGDSLSPADALTLKGNIIEATRTAARLNPTNALLQAQLAFASADIGMNPDAVHAAREALRLDRITPHADRKLPADVHKRLLSELPHWERSGPGIPPAG